MNPHNTQSIHQSSIIYNAHTRSFKVVWVMPVNAKYLKNRQKIITVIDKQPEKVVYRSYRMLLSWPIVHALVKVVSVWIPN